MEAITGNEFLRLVAAGGLIGFLVFCASYSLAVWIRRNRSTPKSGSRLSRLSRLAAFFFFAGLVAAAGIWASNQLEKQFAVVDGQKLFVVPSRADARMEILVPEGPVSEGDLLALFHSPLIDAQLAAVDGQTREAQIRIEVLRSRPPAYDQTLLQWRVQNRLEQEQVRALLLDLQRSKRSLENNVLTLSTAWTRERSQLLSDLTSAEHSEKVAADQVAIISASIERTRNVLPALRVEEMNRNRLTQELERDSARSSIMAIRQRLSALEKKYRAAEESVLSQTREVEAEIAEAKQRSEALVRKSRELETSLEEDARRAEASAAQEVEAAREHLSVLAAERTRILAMAEVRAPFSGTIVYRNLSSGQSLNNLPALALSPTNGISARAWLPRPSVEELSRAGTVGFFLEDALLDRFFTGAFDYVEESASAGDRVIAYFNVNLPPEAFTMLARASASLPVQLLWRPSITANPYFLGSVAIALLAFHVLIFAFALRKSAHSRRGEVLLRWPFGEDKAVEAFNSSQHGPYGWIGQRPQDGGGSLAPGR